MIQETRTHTCRGCGSPNIVKNGTNRSGSPQYHCKECGVYRVLKPKQASSETERQRVLRACLQRCSLRGVERIFDMARQTVTQWIKAHVQHAPDFREACSLRHRMTFSNGMKSGASYGKKRIHDGC